MKKVMVLCLVFMLLNSCCKEIAPAPPYSLIGKWDIAAVDSLRMVEGVYQDLYGYIATLPVSGYVEFKPDSSGSFNQPIRRMVGTDNDFTWHHSALWGRIEFRFNDSEETNGIIFSQLKDTVQLYFADYLNRTPIGVAWFYYVKLVKQN
jgi:hypothetical protein